MQLLNWFEKYFLSKGVQWNCWSVDGIGKYSVWEPSYCELFTYFLMLVYLF